MEGGHSDQHRRGVSACTQFPVPQLECDRRWGAGGEGKSRREGERVGRRSKRRRIGKWRRPPFQPDTISLSPIFLQPTAALIGRLTKDKRLILPRPLNHFDFVIKVFNYSLPQKRYRQLSVPINEEKKNLFLLFSPPFLTFESGWLYANVLRTIFLLLLRVSYEQGLDNWLKLEGEGVGR